MKTCPKLKGTEFFVSEDFSKRIRDIRKELWESASQDKSDGAKVKLGFDKLNINGDMFGWDSANNKRYKIQKDRKWHQKLTCSAIKILNVNCPSVVNKVAELQGMLFSHDADVAVLTETLLSSEIFDNEFVPKGYKVFRGDRGRRGGGVAILFKSSMQLFRMPDAHGIKAIFCKEYINKVPFALGVFIGLQGLPLQPCKT